MVSKIPLVKKLTVWQLNVELLKACIKILSVRTLIDDKNEPISAREIRQLLLKRD